MTSSKAAMARALAFVVFVTTALAASSATGVPTASAAPPPGVSMQGTGPQPPGLGLFSKAALTQEHCSPNGRMWSSTEGTGPYCVNPWPAGKNNGGATAPGVTATTVKVVVYIPSGVSDTQAAAATDTQAAYQYASDTYHTYQLWGRKPVYETVVASGTDETAQRADALKVVGMKPFLVMDVTDPATGAPVFTATLANNKILVASSSTTPAAGAQQSPYRWNYGADPDASVSLAAAFAGRSLSGEKARWAGDKDLQSKPRVFGVIYPQDLVDIAAFAKQFKDNGGTGLAKSVAYDPTDPTKTGEVLPTLVSQLKNAGVTSVIVLADPATLAPTLTAATRQAYSPEWIMTGYGYTDFDVYARQFDQAQMKHAFGVGSLPPYSTPAPGGVTESSLQLFNWYWGNSTTRTNDGGFVNPFVYTALHYAGPTLTAANVKKGLFAAPQGHQRDGGDLHRVRQHRGHALSRVRVVRVRPGDDLVEPAPRPGRATRSGSPAPGSSCSSRTARASATRTSRRPSRSSSMPRRRRAWSRWRRSSRVTSSPPRHRAPIARAQADPADPGPEIRRVVARDRATMP